MKPVLSTRRGIPFFHQKTALEFQKDIYERYHDMVIRQTALHLADEIWEKYPFQAVLDFAAAFYPSKALKVVEIGCGVGRWLGTLAQRYPEATFWGVDFSYQMLKQANEFWVEGKDLNVDWSHKGLPILTKKGKQLDNIKLGLARAENLPFEDNSQEVVLNSFLLDRLENPEKGLQEMHRILQPDGQLIVVTPLNFHQAAHWEKYFPPIQLSKHLTQLGFEIVKWEENIIINEPLDLRGNTVCWKCLGFVAQKREF